MKSSLHCERVQAGKASLSHRREWRTSKLRTVVRDESSWSNRYFHHAVQSLAKQLVSLSDVVQRESVREQWREIDAATAYNLHQPAHALFATRTKRCHDAMIANARGECLIRNRKLA